ncbi:MAG: hypothetical protein K1X89_27460 [Myxococcaceae bacterium]|nr:hypothetical protein [Myxococcaceae bacterium]
MTTIRNAPNAAEKLKGAKADGATKGEATKAGAAAKVDALKAAPAAVKGGAPAKADGYKATQAAPANGKLNPTGVTTQGTKVLAKSIDTVAGVHGVQVVKMGDHVTLDGIVDNRHPHRFDNDGAPAGAYLKLKEPIEVVGEDGKRTTVKEVHISLDSVTMHTCGQKGNNCGSCTLSDGCLVGKNLGEDKSLTVYGRVDKITFGGGEGVAPGEVFAVSGPSVASLGEPRFDGAQWHDAQTEDKVDSLLIKNPDVPIAKMGIPNPNLAGGHPETVLVFEKKAKELRVYTGTFGGPMPADVNKFHGFKNFHIVQAPTAEEKQALTFQTRGDGAAREFTPDQAPRNKKGESLELIGSAEGKTWFLDRKARTAYAVGMAPAPSSAYEVQGVIKFKKNDYVELLPDGSAPPPPYGFWEGVDGREPSVVTPGDQIAHDDGRINRNVRIARRMDPDIQHTSLVKDEPNRYASLSARPDKSVKPDEFRAELRKIVESTAEGRAAVKQIREVMAEAERLASLDPPLAAEPPKDKEAWFDFMLNSYLHAQDLRVWMKALGFGGSSVGNHDLDEMVPVKDLKWMMKDKFSEPWFENYVKSLPDDAEVNCGFLNPNYAAAGYMWGYAALDANRMMNLHRLACHHSGNTQEEIYWVEKALNFMVHHAPLEDFGVRHEPAGDLAHLQIAMENDPAMKTSGIGKAIIKDALKLWVELTNEGKITPWLKIDRKPHDGFLNTPKAEGSYKTLGLQSKAGDALYEKSLLAARAVDGASAGVATAAKAIDAELQAFRAKVSIDVVATKEQSQAIAQRFSQAFTAVYAQAKASPNPKDLELANHLGNAVTALFAQLTVVNQPAAEVFTQAIAEVAAQQGITRNEFIPLSELTSALKGMEEFPKWEAKVRKEKGDDTLATELDNAYRQWKDDGFLHY